MLGKTVQVLLGGWALADVLRYIALLSYPASVRRAKRLDSDFRATVNIDQGKRPSLQLLRRIASAILFLVVATAEADAPTEAYQQLPVMTQVWASWLTFDSLTLGVRRSVTSC